MLVNKSFEDYLKNIYSLGQKSDKITTSAIADELSISSASVTDMIKKLSEKDLLSYTPYRGVKLTKKGEKTALRVIRRHRLLELFLVEVLDFSWDKVHEEAERLEHVVSEELEQRIDHYLGYPKHDPHGDPIPTAAGEIEEWNYTKLSNMEIGDAGAIVKVSDTQTLLQYMDKLGLGLNQTILVKDKEPFDGTMTIKIQGKRELMISREAALHIFVKKSK